MIKIKIDSIIKILNSRRDKSELALKLELKLPKTTRLNNHNEYAAPNTTPEVEVEV